jgi:signal transduction histidine kinase
LGSVSQRDAPLRSGGLRKRLVLVFGATSAALIVGTLIPLGFLLVSDHVGQYADQLERRARSAAPALADPAAAAGELARRFPPGSELQALLLDRSGQSQTLVLDPGTFPKFPARSAEVRAALGGQTATRRATTEAGRRVLVAAPVTRRGRVDGVVWLSASLAPVDDLNSRTWASLGIIGVAALLFAVLVAVAVSRQIARRLEVVAAGAERFAEGRFGEPIRVSGKDEVAHLGSRLNEMARRIERSVARERDFAASASHQLRTPLTAIKIRIEELRSMLPPGVDATAAEYLDEMTQEVDRLTFLTSGLLMMSATEAGAHAEPLPAGAAIEQAVQRLRPLARQSGIGISIGDCDSSALVRAAPGAFEEVIFNLMDNALKYSSNGGVVEVEARRDEDHLLVTVADRGSGISEEEAEHVFDPFYRARRTRTKGSGLGLTICARLCEAAGAAIALRPREGGGTTASVRWPLADAE